MSGAHILIKLVHGTAGSLLHGRVVTEDQDTWLDILCLLKIRKNNIKRESSIINEDEKSFRVRVFGSPKNKENFLAYKIRFDLSPRFTHCRTFLLYLNAVLWYCTSWITSLCLTWNCRAVVHLSTCNYFTVEMII